MEIGELKKQVEQKVEQRDYYGAYELLIPNSKEFLTKTSFDYAGCVVLIALNQDLLEYMGSSKQYEMAFDLHNSIIHTRNLLFIYCLGEGKDELKKIYGRIVGDYTL